MRTVQRNRLSGMAMAIVALMVCAQARAVTIYDFGSDASVELPSVIDNMSSPVYFTAAPGDGLESQTPTVDTLRIGQYSELHIGYTNTAVATDDMSFTVLGDMDVSGKVMLGKNATSDQRNLPNPATTQAIGVAVGSTLRVGSGGHVVLNGFSDGDGGDDKKHSVITAGSVVLDGGALTLQEYSSLLTGVALSGDPLSGTSGHSLTIRNGGVLTVNSGLPPFVPAVSPDPGYWDWDEWEFKGVNVQGDGAGILVDSGGVLAAGNIGGVLSGAAGQRLEVAAGGLLDADRGTLLVHGIDNVVIGGMYRAGLGSRLVVEAGTVTFAGNGAMAMSRDLQRHLNSGAGILADTVLVSASGGVVFQNGMPEKLYSAMGFYGLREDADAEGNRYIGVSTVENGVIGNRSGSDRERFRSNLEYIWNPGQMNRDQSDNIYNLTAVETPGVEAYGASGELNKSVLEAIADGRGMAVTGHGYVDQGVFEMYNGGAQWGVNAAAYNTAGEFMAGLDRRVERIGAEMDRLGEGWGDNVAYETTAGYPSLCATDPNSFDRRFWIGGFGRNEEADLDYGITGYKYRPRGFMAGYDKIIGSFSVGAAAAYGKGNYEDKAAQHSDSKITSYSAGVYGTYHAMNGLYATGHAAFSHMDNDLNDVRGGMRREADHTGYSWSVGARVGYDKLLSDRMTLSPSVGISRVQAVGRAHDEYLDGVGVLRVGEVTRDSTLVPVDLTLSYDLLRSPTSVLRVTGNLGYAYDFDDGGLDGSFSYDGLAGATSMGVAKREPGEHRFNAGAGLIFTGSRIDVGARYDYVKREKETSHQAQGSIGVKF